MNVYIYRCPACQWSCGFTHEPRPGEANRLHANDRPNCPRDLPVVKLMETKLIP